MSLAALAASILLALPVPVAGPETVRVAPCAFVPVDAEPVHAPPAVDRFRTPSAVPPGTVAFSSPDGFGGREYFLGPATGTCVAHGGMDEDFDQRITLPGQHAPAFEQVFGAGGDSQIRYSCRYLPAIRAFAQRYFHLHCGSLPATEHTRVLNTGEPGLHAAVVTVPAGVRDPQFTTSGTAEVLAVVLAFDYGADGPDYRKVTSAYADCRAGDPVCRASLHVFAGEVIAWQSRYNGFRAAGDPAARIWAQVRGAGAPERVPAAERDR